MQRRLFALLRRRIFSRSEDPSSSPSSSSSSAAAAVGLDGVQAKSAAASSLQGHHAAPVCGTSSYGDCIDRYIRDLEEYCSASREAVQSAQQRFDAILVEREKAKNEYRREYMRTFIPLVFVTVLFIREQTNRNCAEQTHYVLKEYASRSSSLKRVVL
ncbi:uncharacterized protein TM35_000093130 [Trypanosoma theileri]|uniref:Uncharacterized protein n=1 Tax=Trypanosoma theileri TaxID=67003 RepID=A0A1X0P0M2_9TRYP|nr:uncharacterized protein TM35_000093130 [Trypanosoma theileri]ORC90263.1 hypothetical protein TM35_000093130 [Trypanosoma theileri]